MIDFLNIKETISILSAMLTPTIAVLGAYIAWCQWTTNEQKRKQDLYQMRMEHLLIPLQNWVKTVYDLRFCRIDYKQAPVLLNTALDNFQGNFIKYRFLLSEDDAEEIQLYFNKLTKFCSKFLYDVKTLEPDEFDRNILYLGGFIQEILSKYINFETRKISNLYSFLSFILGQIFLFFLPKRLQRKIKRAVMEKSVIKKLEAATDETIKQRSFVKL